MGIQAKQLSVKKRAAVILDNLNFTIPSGSVTGLIGPSGSGKTTLMRAIVGVQKISGGSLTILGQPAGSASLRRMIGYVTQEMAIYHDLTVIENLSYFAALTTAPKGQVEELLDTVRLTKQKNQLVATLSGGQKARVSLAIALLGSPDLLVLDEPTVGLDPLLRQELWQLFSELATAGKTLLISSHVMDEAERCASLLLLREGKLLWQETRDKLLVDTHTASVQDAFMKLINDGEDA